MSLSFPDWLNIIVTELIKNVRMPKTQDKQVDKNDPEYLEKRKRNNEAIRKSREKAKQKAEETQKKVEILRKDNTRLEDKINVLGQEMQFLKDIFLAKAGANEEANKAYQAAESKRQDKHVELMKFILFNISVAEGIARSGVKPDDAQQSIIDELLESLSTPGASSPS